MLTGESGGTSLYFLGAFVAFCAVLLLAWATTSFVGRKFKGERKSRNLQVVETLAMGLDRSLVLVRVGEKYYLLANSRGRMDNLGEVDSGTVIIEPVPSGVLNFRTILDRYSTLGQKSEQGENEKNVSAKIKDSLKRLRKGQNHDGDNHLHG